MKLRALQRRPEWWPNDPLGPMPPLWFYFFRLWWWPVIIVCEVVAINVLWLLDAPEIAHIVLTCAIWFGLGVQVRGIWQQHAEHKAKMEQLRLDREARMSEWERAEAEFIRAVKKGL